MKQEERRKYHKAVNQILAVLEAMDRGEVPTRQMNYWKKKFEKRSGHMPNGQRWFLINKLFELRLSEIAEMEGLDKKSS